MATKSEDIRLQIDKVRHKKSDGTLYLMSERLAWMPNARNNFTISHKYSDIKTQKISPEGKAKIQLQIVLQTGDNTTFQFENLEDRTTVKDALLQILPQFKGKMPKDRERKGLLLSKNPHLLQLYKDLVETKIVPAEDFWAQFTDDSETLEPQSEQQDVGVSADFMAGISLSGKPIKGHINVETLLGVLRTYPKVAQRHQELVPAKMTETEFWNKFFQSRYFNRDRTKDLFSDCAKSDDKEWTASAKKGEIDPFVNLDMFDDNAYKADADNFQPSSRDENPNHQLCKRISQINFRLLESLKKSKEVSETIQESQSQSSSTNDSQSASTAPAGAASKTAAAATAAEQAHPESFREHLPETVYDDLAGEDNFGVYLDESAQVASRMHRVDKEVYSIVSQGQKNVIDSNMVRGHVEALKSWVPRPTECIASQDATEALKNLSPAGYLMRSTNTHRLEDTVPEELQAKLKNTYYASNELLRHFWLCFPAIEPSLESKLIKVHETLKKFETNKLQPFHDSLPRDQRHLLDHLLRGQFKAASRKFEMWKSKRRQRESIRSRGTAKS